MKQVILFGVLCLGVTAVFAQPGPACRWVLGYNAQPPTGGQLGTAVLNFCAGSPEVEDIGQGMSFLTANASMSSPGGELLFYTNGIYVANAQHQPMPNGQGINAGHTPGDEEQGLYMIQGVLALPFPGRSGLYILFHAGFDAHFEFIFAGTPLFYSIIDMNLEGGLGDVTIKNQVLSNDYFAHGKLVAVRHANGRDWWVVAPELLTGKIRRFLVTPQGVQDRGATAQPMIQQPHIGQAAFSPDGAFYAQLSNNWREATLGLDILFFDRCTGEFSILQQHLISPVLPGENGLAFSPDSRWLYVSTIYRLLQFDMNAPDIAASADTIAEAFLDPDAIEGPGVFGLGQTGPDGRVYFSSYYRPFLYVVTPADSTCSACPPVVEGLSLPYRNASMPNFPNFSLGALPGSPCDTLVTSSRDIPASTSAPLRIFPNPAQGYFTVAAAAPATRLRLYDSMGRQVLAQALAAGQPEHRIVLPPGLPAGVYVAVAEGSAGVLGRGRVVVRRH